MGRRDRIGAAPPREARGMRLAYVIGTYPRPTTTFIDREIDVVRRSGIGLQVISIRRPDNLLSDRHRAIESDVHYVLPAGFADLLRSHVGFLVRRPGAYVRTLLYVVSRPHPGLGSRAKSVAHFGVGVHVARLIRDRYPADHIHAHFVDRAALIAMIAGRLLDRPYSATAHANDLYVDPVLLPEKAAGSKFIATCTRYNVSHLAGLVDGPSRDRLRCIYHGLDVGEFRPAPSVRARPLILAVGQLKEKKGFGHLLRACRVLLDRGLAFDCEIVGEGPLRGELGATIGRLGLSGNVGLLGALPHERVVAKYAEAAIFVLPCVVSSDGDRDGIPNVILEAMAMELPVVSTRHSGVPEAVEDGRSGLLVEPGEPVALADALERLLADPALRTRLGRHGRRRVVELFDADTNVRRLMAEFAA